jgi:hypothetical protein
MVEDDSGRMVAGWAYSAMLPEVANSARAAVSTPLSQVPREHGGVSLTQPAHAFLAYWWHIRGEKVIPHTEDVSPPQMRTLAPYVRYMQWEGDALVHRLWGSALTEGSGVDLTGEDMLAYVAPERRVSRRTLFQAACDHPCGCVLVVRSDSDPGSGHAFEMTFLPVAVADGQRPRLIGTLQWCEARDVFEPLSYHPERHHLLAVEKTAFIDVGAGTPHPDLLDGQ